MFSNKEYQQYIERLKAISQPGYVYSNCFYLKNSYHKSHSSVASITNTVLERFLSFMNCFHIFIQIAFIWKTLITKVIVQSLVSHILHWKGFFLSFMNYFYMIFQIVLSEILELRLIYLFLYFYSSEINSLPI